VQLLAFKYHTFGKRKISLNIENISFFAFVLEKIVVILPTGEKKLGFCPLFSDHLEWLI